MRRGRVGSLWAWRVLALGVLLVLSGMLVWLAGRAEELRDRAWDKALLGLETGAANLASPLREELQAALVCLKLRREAGLLDPGRSGAFLRETRNALSDERLDSEEAQRLVLAARALCGATP